MRFMLRTMKESEAYAPLPPEVFTPNEEVAKVTIQ